MLSGRMVSTRSGIITSLGFAFSSFFILRLRIPTYEILSPRVWDNYTYVLRLDHFMLPGRRQEPI